MIYYACKLPLPQKLLLAPHFIRIALRLGEVT
jgi:hypothetical protein